MITLYDSVTLSAFPANAQAVAGYVGGSFPTYSNLVARFPDAHHLSVAVNAEEDADCLDIENGDARPDQAPAWYHRQVARGVKKPVFYADASTIPAVIAALTAAGIKREQYFTWVAHYTFTEHLEPGSDATQWTDRALDRNLDQSLCTEAFFGVNPPAKNSAHYDWFINDPLLVVGKKLNERAIVVAYDKYRAEQTPTKHPHRIQLDGLRTALKLLAGRVYTVAHEHPKNGKPSWGIDHRGWRYQQLIHRAQGQRFV